MTYFNPSFSNRPPVSMEPCLSGPCRGYYWKNTASCR